MEIGYQTYNKNYRKQWNDHISELRLSLLSPQTLVRVVDEEFIWVPVPIPHTLKLQKTEFIFCLCMHLQCKFQIN